MDTYYIDGEYVDEDNAVIPAKDITVLRGYGVFDFLITYNKRPFYLDAHIARLENSAREINLILNHSAEQIGAIVTETLARNPHHTESNVRIVYSGGISPDGVTPQGNGILMVMATPKYELPDWWYTDGAKIITVDMERFIPTSKSTNYLSAVFAQQKAHAKGAIEAIYKDRENRVLEGTTTNFFCIKGDTLITPPDNILPGITRGVVLDLLKDSYDIQLRHIQNDELPQMDEIFITASNKEIVPVIQIDDLVVGDGRPGERTKAVLNTWADYTRAYGLGEVG
ncbi:MAG TPA: branched-chain amino acid aminotransferase [Desulfobacteraceae bacterium]|nr:branched-chain amino acid aminotransferase [Desulfobacteraceae bacterium]